MHEKLILLTNDDGINSLGLQSLYEVIKDKGNTICVAPVSPSSAVSKSLTFHKPIRYSKYTFPDGKKGYSTTGSPADNVLVGIHLLKKKPDLVVSGINYGDNSSIHSMLTSGTCAAAFEAYFNKIPAVAFSTSLSHDSQLIEQKGIDFSKFAMVSGAIVELLLEIEWPIGLAFLNVNFPATINSETKVHVTYPTLYKYDNYMVQKDDPRGLPYLWLWGERKTTFPEGSDTWAVVQKKGISVTPISLNLHDITDQSQGLACYIQEHLDDLPL